MCLWTIFDVDGFSTYEEECGMYRKTPIEILRTDGIIRIRDTHYNPTCEVTKQLLYKYNLCIKDGVEMRGMYYVWYIVVVHPGFKQSP